MSSDSEAFPEDNGSSDSWRSPESASQPDSDHDSEAEGWRGLLNAKEMLSEKQLARLRLETEAALAASGGWGTPPLTVGPYRIIKQLGSGGCGDVYKAVHRASQRLAAVKLLRRGLNGNSEVRERFKREAKIASQLQSDHVIATYEIMIDSDSDHPFIAMELIEGETLEEKIRREKTLEPREAARIIRESSLGLAEAHAKGLVHRDVKPSNIMLDRDRCRAKLGDFGLARWSDDTRMTEPGAFLGTPAYMSPEQAMWIESVGPASDIFSMGVILYEALAGIAPFRGEDHGSLLSRTIHEEPSRLRKFNPRIPRDLETIVHKCLEKEPNRRYASAEALAADLLNWLEHRPIAARPSPWWIRAWKSARRRPALAAASVLIAIGLPAYTVELWRHQRELGNKNLEIIKKDGVLNDKDSELKAKESELLDKTSELKAKESELHDKTKKLQAALREAEIAAAAARDLRHKGQRYLQQSFFSKSRSLFYAGREFEAGNILSNIPAAEQSWDWDRLALETSSGVRPVRILGVHRFKVLDVKLSPDLRRLYSSGEDGRLIERDVTTGAERELQAGSWSPSLRTWRVATKGSSYDDPPGATASDCQQALCVLENGELLVGASLKGKGTIWSLDTGASEVLVNHSSPLTTVAASRDGRSLLFGGSDGAVIQYDRDKKTSAAKGLGGGEIMAIRSLDNRFWLVATRKGGIRLLDREVREVRSFSIDGELWDIDLAPDGRALAAAREGKPSLQEFKLTPGESGLSLELAREYELPDEEARFPEAAQVVRFDAQGQFLWASDDRGRLVRWRRGVINASIANGSGFACPPQSLDPNDFPLSHQRMVTAIELAADGHHAYLGGQDSTVTRWALDGASTFWSFQVGAQPILRPVAYVADQFWVADAQGSLEIWNARVRQSQASLPHAHQGRIIALDAATRAEIAVTAGEDRAIRLWRRGDQGDIRPASGSNEIKLDRTIRSLAITPDGSRIAAYDDSDMLCLWSVGDRRLIRETQLAHLQNPGSDFQHGRVAFSGDGKSLAVCGQSQDFFIYSGETLELKEKLPNIVAGDGGTAIVWAPRGKAHGLASDTMGRVKPFLEPQDGGALTKHPTVVEQRVEDLVLAPDGRVVVQAHGDGRAVVSGSRELAGDIRLTLKSGHEGASGVRFDASGRLLAMAHANGKIAVWDSLSPSYAVKPQTALSNLLLKGDAADGLEFRRESIALDSRDRVCLVYHRSQGHGQTTSVWVGRETGLGQGFVQEKIGEMKQDGPVGTSCAIRVQGNEFLALHRKTTADDGGQLVLTRCDVETLGQARAEPLVEEIVTESAGNHGFHAVFHGDEGGKPAILHFSFAGYYQHRAVWNGRNWRQDVIGLQGDGMFAKRAVGPDGETHLVVRLNRFNSDPAPLVYFKLSNPDRREVIAALLSAPAGVAIGPDGSIAVLYCRRVVAGMDEVKISRKTSAGWVSSVIAYGYGASNLVWGRDRVLRFVLTDSRTGRILLYEGSNDQWRTREIWSDPDFESAEADVFEHFASILLDSRDRPVIVVVKRAGKRSQLFVLRPDGV